MAGTLPLLSVQPTRALVDERFQVVVRNLPPGFPVTLRSFHHSEDKDDWEGFGHYVSDNRGTVTVSENASVGGTYEGVEAMGLLWSMRPVPGSRTGLRLRKKNVLIPTLVLLSVYDGHVSEGFGERTELARVEVERWYLAPGVRRIDIRQNGVKGTLFIPPGRGPFPGVLDMWGGGGGLVEYRSALLASHGFVSLALEYLPLEQLNSYNLEFNYFELAFKIVRDHPLVLKDRVGLMGLSFGTSVALSMVAYSKDVNARCCVCISGSHAHSINKPLAAVMEDMVKTHYKTRIDEDGHVIWRDTILPLPTEPGTKVDVGRIKCPLLLIVGQDDQNWATVESAEDMALMMQAAGNDHLLTTLSYPGAGHLIEPPYTPLFRASNFRASNLQGTGEKVIMLWGGRTKPHADAQEDSWEKILAFLRQHLVPSYRPQARL